MAEQAMAKELPRTERLRIRAAFCPDFFELLSANKSQILAQMGGLGCHINML